MELQVHPIGCAGGPVTVAQQLINIPGQLNAYTKNVANSSHWLPYLLQVELQSPELLEEVVLLLLEGSGFCSFLGFRV